MTAIDQLVRDAVKSGPCPPLAPWDEIARRAASPRRPRWRSRALILGAAVVALAGALLVASPFDHSTTSPLARASAAISEWPANRILHVRVLMVSHFDQGDELDESWQLTSTPFTVRRRTAFPANGTGRQVVESVASADGLGQAYDWRSQRIVQTMHAPAAWRPRGVEQATRGELQAMLRQNHWKSLGARTLDGHHVLGFGVPHARLYLDATTYLPVLSQSFGMGAGPESRGYDQHYTWTLLAATPANRKLLDLSSVHPRASVVARGGAAWNTFTNRLGRLWQPPVTPGA